jgi:hypothetical protein
MTKHIELTQGKRAIVDDEDFEWLNKHSWHTFPDNNKSRDVYYAIRTVMKDNKKKTLRMHRVIINAPKNKVVDHINGDGLDNRKINLRIVTQRENMQNKHIKYTSKYPGVSQCSRSGNWTVKFRDDEGKGVYYGAFKTEEEAYEAYKWGLNEIKEGRRIKKFREFKGTSKYPGIHYDKRKDRWIGRIYRNKKTIHVGSFLTEMDAYKALIEKKNEMNISL